MWCQTVLAPGAGKEKKKSISDGIGDRKLAAAQIRLPTFDKWKWANLVYPSNGCNPIHSSRGYQNTWTRVRESVRGRSFQPLHGIMEGEGKWTSCSFYSERKKKRLAALLRPGSSLSTLPLLLLSNQHSRWAQLCLKDAAPSAGVRGRPGRHVNGKPLLLNISHLIWKVLNRAFN